MIELTKLAAAIVGLAKTWHARTNESKAMPEISLFFGIRITMHWNDHQPPHFHVAYAGYAASILVEDGVVMAGYLPNRQLRLVLAWLELHRDELMQNWELARLRQPLNAIKPLS